MMLLFPAEAGHCYDLRGDVALCGHPESARQAVTMLRSLSAPVLVVCTLCGAFQEARPVAPGRRDLSADLEVIP